ncbi:MAG: hypothetical protein PHI90_06580 [Clostridia bacterium]|nr:hypothetical protein [Clostridia bacterium]MDD4048476.1 hypothetical protein [Clostridia bacterium]
MQISPKSPVIFNTKVNPDPVKIVESAWHNRGDVKPFRVKSRGRWMNVYIIPFPKAGCLVRADGEKRFMNNITIIISDEGNFGVVDAFPGRSRNIEKIRITKGRGNGDIKRDKAFEQVLYMKYLIIFKVISLLKLRSEN